MGGILSAIFSFDPCCRHLNCNISLFRSCGYFTVSYSLCKLADLNTFIVIKTIPYTGDGFRNYGEQLRHFRQSHVLF